MLTQMESVAQRITGQASLRMPETIDEDRRLVLAKYALGTATTVSPDAGWAVAAQPALPSAQAPPMPASAPPQEDSNDLLRNDVAKEQVWRSSEFRWRRLLSQRELDMLTDGDRKSFGRTVTYYVLQSERAAMFFHAVNRYFLINILVGFAVGVGYYALRYLDFHSKNPDGYAPTYMTADAAFLGMLTWVISVFVVGALQRSSRNAPYGLRALDSFALSFLGPFRPVIQDYARPKD
jgi:hypothetical protein